MNVHQLRKRWKPIKEQLVAQRPGHPTVIRFHRACSWLKRVEEMDQADHDLMLMCQWIALNALYGQLDTQTSNARPDKETLETFLARILALDHDGVLEKILIANKKLVIRILEDPFLSRHFWKNPSKEEATKTTSARRKVLMWYANKQWQLILDEVAAHVYQMRCQLIHGAATHGGRLNRASLRHCWMFMDLLLPAIMTVWTDHGADFEWGPMCYPPLA